MNGNVCMNGAVCETSAAGVKMCVVAPLSTTTTATTTTATTATMKTANTLDVSESSNVKLAFALAVLAAAIAALA